MRNTVAGYLVTLKAAAHIAYEKNVFVTVGIKPRYPHTGMGHIKKGKLLGEIDGKKFYKVDKFVEKPPLELAKKYTASGNYYWNAGQFVWRARDILAAMEKYASDISNNLNKISQVLGTSEEKTVLKKVYETMPKISIDYAIAEKVQNMLVVEGDFFWTDIGDWTEVWENLDKDKQGNVIIDGDEPGGRIINFDTSNALIHMDGRLITLVDVDNLIIVDTKDALLVCNKNKSQNVKKIVEQLKVEGKNDLL